MFNKLALVLTGLMVAVSSAGCCGCLHGYGYGANYGNRCAPCNNGCAPAGGGGFYPPVQGAYYSGDMSQTAFASGGYTSTAFAPVSSAYIPTATTTTAAAAPGGVIQGAPIYNTAVVPMSSLPPY